jgi:Flp pilus assembly protein TadD
MRFCRGIGVDGRANKWNKASLCLLLTFLIAAAAASAQTTDGSSVESALPTVHELLSAGRYQEAETVLRDYITRDKLSAKAHYLLGYTLFRENRSKDSLAEYTVAASLEPPSAEDLKNVALNYVLLDDFPDAKKWLGESIARNDKDPEAWYALGRVHYEQGDFWGAIDCFKRALVLAPKSVKAENNLGLAYEGLNRKTEALVAYRAAIDWQRGSSHPSEQPLLNMAIMMMHDGQFDEALPLLSQAVTIAPQSSKSHEQLGKLYVHTDQLAKAQSELEQAVALEPNSAPLHFLLGQIYHRRGDEQKAKEEFERSAVLNGTHSTIGRE